ncbi:hypothetical protein PPE_06600 [Paenibacillus polymyxa E681]|nr:hypothetical protein PPE_06600 [Paenibacillus polymyxa E681]
MWNKSSTDCDKVESTKINHEGKTEEMIKNLLGDE